MFRRLVSDKQICDASVWRLADWSTQDVDASTAELGRMLMQCPSLNCDHPGVVAALARLHRPGDRRDPWTALCALAVFWADAHDDRVLFHRAGFEVLVSYRQARRGQLAPAPDALDELLTSYLRLHPQTTAVQLFNHCQSLARTRMVVEDADNASLTYRIDPTSSRLKTLKWLAFKVRVSRIRKRLAAAPTIKRPVGENVFRWPNLEHPVVVTCAG